MISPTDHLSGAQPIIQYWHSPDLPAHIDRLTQSFAQLNPERPHMLFNSDTADAFISQHFTRREVEAFRACNVPSMQADYLRYCAILNLGGIWADAGYLCVRSLDDLLDERHGGVVFRRPTPVTDQVLINGFFAFTPSHHPFLRLTLDIATTLIETRWNGRVNEVTGPLIMTVIYRLHRAESLDILQAEMQREIGDAHPYVPYVERVCELIGDTDRAMEAFEGIEVHGPDRHADWVRYQDLPHRQTSSHWGRVGSDIYKTPASG